MLPRLIAIGVLLTLLIPPGMAQRNTTVDPAFNAWLQYHQGTVAMVDVHVHGDVNAVRQALAGMGGHIKLQRPGLASVHLPLEHVHALALVPGVRWLEFDGSPGVVLNDSMRVVHRLNEAQAGMAPLPQGYDGTGVVVGMIDAGLDWTHPDMRHADGSTRVLHYWDQTLTVNEYTPEPYGYGRAWDSTQINAGLMTAVDQPSYWGHGTVVTGTAAGNGLANGRHAGGAPGADLVVVSLNMGAGNFRARVADAVHFILAAAAAAGKPAVINASVGTYLGSHDGLDASALLIDDMLQAQAGQAMVCAVGNSNGFAPYHLHTEASADTSFTWFTQNASSGLGFAAVFFELWADQADLDQVHFAVGADRVAPSLQYRGRTPFRTVEGNVGQTVMDTLWSLSGARLGVVQYHVAERGDQYRMQVLLQQPDSSTYRFRFITTGQGRFDVWSSAQLGTSNMVLNIPTVDAYPDIAHYVLPDNEQHIVDSWACSPHVITVGNHLSNVAYHACNDSIVPITDQPGTISGSSSKGPARHGLIKPDIAASGDVRVSAIPMSMLPNLTANEPYKLAEGCMHGRNGGSSMAAPVVTGAVALLLQQCPNATVAGIKQALATAAVTDVHTGAAPNSTWGHGKLDAFAALVGNLLTPITLTALGPDTLCEGDVVLVQADGSFAHYEWSNGGSGPQTQVTSSGPLSVIGHTAGGCHTGSDTLHFVVHPAPAVPVITVDGALLSTGPAAQYQWFHNGTPIDGAVNDTLIAEQSGEHTVQITDEHGCTATSMPVTVILASVVPIGQESAALWPSPVGDRLHVRMATGTDGSYRIHDGQGALVAQGALLQDIATISVAHLAAGTYTITVVGQNGPWSQRFVKQP